MSDCESERCRESGMEQDPMELFRAMMQAAHAAAAATRRFDDSDS